ncbi:tyrosine-protein phosphatase [uncultured Brevundimonas sp.]|uniref:tyrosine-protein phosphatase n=1 Tax=uncultured Brevundimonas sp. TaxID=213418 RepID=UPI0026295425|nr:tyrosine-protein phosphatase [uncultured Brevundimonas sp.]
MSDRLLSFEAIENFRDFGGYRGRYGEVRRGVLFRSGQLSRASDADLMALADLNLSDVVDLRRSSERAKQPDRLPEGWAGRMISTDIGGDGEAPHIQFLKSGALTEETGRDYMANTYRRMPFDPAHVALFRDWFDALAQAPSALLVHCAAGKDRTGLLCALTQTVLGVEEDDIFADYMATNQAVDLKGRAGDLALKLEKVTGRPVSHEAVVAFLGVRADFLHGAFEAIRKEAGTVERYLSEVLGVDVARRQMILSHLVI